LKQNMIAIDPANRERALALAPARSERRRCLTGGRHQKGANEGAH
jgi:hypothetical protein